jgi:hypothetical protein
MNGGLYPNLLIYYEIWAHMNNSIIIWSKFLFYTLIYLYTMIGVHLHKANYESISYSWVL